MDPRFQNGLLAAYRVLLRTGLLETRPGYAVFERVYDLYKAVLEASSLRHVRDYVRPGSRIVDVGAHVGFFTQRFAAWVGPGGRVIALEPEPVNFGRLARRLRRTGLASRVEAINAAAVEASGSYRLRVDPTHPGDHQLAAEGLPVSGIALDRLLEQHDWRPISLLKIDVQGAEARVLAGATETIRRFRPSLLVEVDDGRLRRQGSSAEGLLGLLASLGYTPQHLSRSGVSRVLGIAEAVDIAGGLGRYADFLFAGVNAERYGIGSTTRP
jgi:FkbM family methyltransferase